MKGASLFSGFGGLDLGAEQAGIDIQLQVEIDPFCQRVLVKHWPKQNKLFDIRDVRKSDLEGIDILFGGFPCQPVSQAGKKKGELDERWLWGEYLRCIYISRPRYIVIENVKALLFRRNGGLEHTLIEGILFDLAVCGYDAEWQVISAAALGAPHLRERVFIIAYIDGKRPPYALSRGLAQESWRSTSKRYTWRLSESRILRDIHGIPNRVERIRGLGNAVVPRVAELVFRCLMEYERSLHENVLSLPSSSCIA